MLFLPRQTLIQDNFYEKVTECGHKNIRNGYIHTVVVFLEWELKPIERLSVENVAKHSLVFCVLFIRFERLYNGIKLAAHPQGNCGMCLCVFARNQSITVSGWLKARIRDNKLMISMRLRSESTSKTLPMTSIRDNLVSDVQVAWKRKQQASTAHRILIDVNYASLIIGSGKMSSITFQGFNALFNRNREKNRK